jgi:hypothetical protein
MVTLPSGSRVSAEGGGNQPITVLAGTSEAFAPVMVAMVTSPRICRTAHPTGAACRHTASADVMDITESSISFARPGFADFRHSYGAHSAAPLPDSWRLGTQSANHRCFWLCAAIMVPIRLGGCMCEVAHTPPKQIGRSSLLGH